MHKNCMDCRVDLSVENTYRKGAKRCRKCECAYQAGRREARKGSHGLSETETRYAGNKGQTILKYNPRRQLVDVYASVSEGGRESVDFWAGVFGKESSIHEGSKYYHLRVAHVSRSLWEEAVVDLGSEE